MLFAGAADILDVRIMPSQFFCEGRPAPAERLLALAVISLAFDDIETGMRAPHSRRAQSLYRDAIEWIFADDTDWPYAFIPLCEKLNLNPQYLRMGARQLHRTGV